MGLSEDRKVVSREKRTSTITAYQGNIKTLTDELKVPEVRQRIRTFSQGNKDEILEALRLLSKIKDAPIVIHGAVGCSASELYFTGDQSNSTWYSTDLNEKDTIMGGDHKLRDTIYRVYRKYKPEVIFVVGTPIVAINNDDISSVILELEEELDVRILSVYTDGFKSKAGINGSDIVLHTIGRELIQQGMEGEKEDFLNLISVTENPYAVRELERLLNYLEVNVNLLPSFASIDNIRKAHLAKASVAVNADEAEVLLEILQEKANVPIIHSKTPIGVIGTMEWLKNIGKQLHIQEKVISLIAKEEERIEKYISKQLLRGKKVYIEAPIHVAASLAGLIEELGGEVTGLSIDHVDTVNCAALKGLSEHLPVKVGEGQPFELVNILLKNKPDYYVGTSAHASLAGKLGILPISLENKILYGYEGVVELIQSFQQADKRKSLVDYLAENTELPYTQSWTNKNVNWYIKQEVK